MTRPSARVGRVMGVAILATVCMTQRAHTQDAPPIRPLGAILARSTEPLEAVSQVIEVAGGRVIVHDNRGRRVVLLDSALAYIKPIVDTTASTGRAYGSRIGGLIAARGDTSLFADPATVSLLVINGNGKIIRTIAAPSPNAVRFMVGGPFGTPATDQAGRLIYRMLVDPTQPGGILSFPDSSLIVRADLRRRTVDTIAKFRIPQTFLRCCVNQRDGDPVTAPFINPIPWTDDWAVLANGAVAIVRGQEYRVEIVEPDGMVLRGPKLPFDWERLSDADKQAIIDSTRTAIDQLKSAVAREAAIASATRSSRQLPPREAGGPQVFALPDYNQNMIEWAPIIGLVGPDEMPDYRPAFR